MGARLLRPNHILDARKSAPDLPQELTSLASCFAARISVRTSRWHGKSDETPAAFLNLCRHRHPDMHDGGLFYQSLQESMGSNGYNSSPGIM